MSKENRDTTYAELKQLWGGGEVPPLTSEQTDLALVLWQKIKALKQREQKMQLTKE